MKNDTKKSLLGFASTQISGKQQKNVSGGNTGGEGGDGQSTGNGGGGQGSGGPPPPTATDID